MATRYWVVSLTVPNSAAPVWSRLQESISKNAFDTPLYRFNIPNLRVGTLDSLLAISDDLFKSNAFIEGVSHKIRRQIEELERVSGVVSSSLTVDGVPVDSYLTRFVWDEAKYPTMSPLKEIVDGIHVQVAKIEDDLKVRVSEYNNVRSQLNAINRKQSGSLAVRDLSNLVKPEDIITSEHLTTLLAIIPKYSQKDWLSSYETLTSYVVPRSSKKLYEDNEYALYTVTMFSRDADNFRTKARERGFQIRDFEYNSETQESRKQELEKLMQDQDTLRSSLLQWCYASYGEVFSSWMHFCAVRVFAESILRYGLPPSFLSVVLAPSLKSEKKVRSIIEELCGSQMERMQTNVASESAEPILAAPANPTNIIVVDSSSSSASLLSSGGSQRPQWPTIDGPLGLSEEDSIPYARRFFKFGFFLLPFLWAVNCFYFWPVLRHSPSFPRIRHYVVGSAIGFTVFAAILSSWALTFAIGGEQLFGHVWNDLVMYNVADRLGLTGWI